MPNYIDENSNLPQKTDGAFRPRLDDSLDRLRRRARRKSSSMCSEEQLELQPIRVQLTTIGSRKPIGCFLHRDLQDSKQLVQSLADFFGRDLPGGPNHGGDFVVLVDHDSPKGDESRKEIFSCTNHSKQHSSMHPLSLRLTGLGKSLRFSDFRNSRRVETQVFQGTSRVAEMTSETHSGVGLFCCRSSN